MHGPVPPLIDSTVSLSSSDISASNMFTAMTSGGTDRIRFSVVELSYPRAFTFDSPGVQFSIDDARDGAYLEIDANAISDPIIYDLSSGDRMSGVLDQGIIKINLPPGPNTRKLILADASSGVMAPTITAATDWTRLDASNANYIIISHPDLIAEGQNSYVADYAQYRQSTVGGNYQTQIIDIRQLVDQFAYGIHMHPLSIKNFVNFIDRNWSNPQYLFLIGKGLEYGQARLNEEPYEYLPVYGVPGSDNLLTSRGNSSVPRIPVGRLAVRTADQINIYLDKIKTMEDQIANAPQTIEDRGWMKRVLHLGGGVGSSEQRLLRSHLDQMSSILEDNKIGPDVFTQSITSQDQIQDITSEEVLNLINEGVMMKTYFGHGSIATTQFNAYEDPQFLRNQDRYPIMMSLGCYTGNVFVNDESLGETNILVPNKGASIYLATSGLGFLNALNNFGRTWYKFLGEENYGESIGQAFLHIMREFDDSDQIGIKTLVQQLIFHGDPAFTAYPNKSPDYTIDEKSISFDPTIITTSLDSFEVNLAVVNLSTAIPNSIIDIDIEMKLSDGKVLPLLFDSIMAPSFSDSISLVVPLPKGEDLESSRLLITLNKSKRTSEEDFSNNSVSIDGQEGIILPIIDNSLVTFFPPDFSIQGSDPTLIASTSNPLATTSNYIFQLDTTALFNSPLLIEERINSGGGTIRWNPSFVPLEEKVYYWRATEDTLTEDGSYVWSQKSFLYSPQSDPGWNQSHYFQFLQNNLEGISYKNRNMAFDEGSYEIRIINHPDTADRTPLFFFDGRQFGSPFRGGGAVSFKIIPINPNTQKWLSGDEAPAFQSHFVAGTNGTWFFNPKSQTDRLDMVKFIEEGIPDDYFVFLFTHIKQPSTPVDITAWWSDTLSTDGLSIFKALEEQGASMIDLMDEYGFVPYCFMFQKGKGGIDESIGTMVNDEISARGNGTFNITNGAMTSSLIGPASTWNDLSYSIDESALGTGDTYSISLFGINADGSEKQIFEEVSGSITSLNHIDAKEFPSIRLNIETKDSIDRTSPNLIKWKISHQGVGDAAFASNNGFILEPDTVELGSPISVSFDIENVTTFDLDSIPILFTITDNNNQLFNTVKNFDPLPGESRYRISTEIETSGLSGSNHLLKITLNPERDLPEISYNNNILLTSFSSISDQINPLLDVTFDGVRIMDEDIVSPNPLIRLSIKDEDQEMLITDSSLFDIQIKHPDNTTEFIDLDDDNIQFRPAENSSNVAYLEIEKSFETDGVYELIAQARDASNNISGANALRIRFTVITKQSITNIIPYPNPFSDNTRFLYTLTGAPPDSYQIQISTVSGQIVREISAGEIGPLKIGTHLTDFHWDGTDNFGDRLANGVYLYRFINRDQNGRTLEKRFTSADNLFEKDYGKIVILR